MSGKPITLQTHVEITSLKRIHEAPLFHVTKYTATGNGLVIYRITSGHQAIDFSARGIVQLATFFKDFTEEG